MTFVRYVTLTTPRVVCSGSLGKVQPDVFEVHLEVVSRNGVILFPEEVHDCKSGLVLNIPEVGVHLRNHDYYMGERPLCL